MVVMLVLLYCMMGLVTFGTVDVQNDVILSTQVGGGQTISVDVYDVFTYATTSLILLYSSYLWTLIFHPKETILIRARVRLVEEPNSQVTAEMI
mmetsp:Transcript_4542/g.5262  ORF Transcript_4542/g.5262 Transcript_4542/m.5262 type:complete len:94 (-) Transcript_4542:460-741(-)